MALHYSDQFVQLVKKYAVVVFVFLIVQFGLNIVVPIVTMDLGLWGDPVNRAALEFMRYAPYYLLNLISAALVYSDMKKTDTLSWSVILVTVMFNEFGICLFLLLVLRKATKRVDAIKES